MSADQELTRDLIAEDYPAAERQARVLGLALRRGTSGDGEPSTDLFVDYVAPDGEKYLLRLRCDGYDRQAPSFQFVNPAAPEETGINWWPRMANSSAANNQALPRGDNGEIVYCTIGIREYHRHSSHRAESYAKEKWKLATVVWLAWRYLYQYGAYQGRGGV